MNLSESDKGKLTEIGEKIADALVESFVQTFTEGCRIDCLVVGVVFTDVSGGDTAPTTPSGWSPLTSKYQSSGGLVARGTKDHQRITMR